MKKKTFLFFSFMAIATVPNLNCNGSEGCKDALCDLTTDVVIAGASTILAGVPFNVPNVIRNIADATIACLTLPAGESESRLKIDYDAAGNGSYNENRLNNNFAVPGINAGDQANENYTFSFNTPGQYRLITFADDKEQVSERDESNNASTPDIATAGRLSEPSKQTLIITVLPNPNYTKSAKTPDVELINRTVTITPQ